MSDRDRSSRTLFAAHVARMQSLTPATVATSSSSSSSSNISQPAMESGATSRNCTPGNRVRGSRSSGTPFGGLGPGPAPNIATGLSSSTGVQQTLQMPSFNPSARGGTLSGPPLAAMSQAPSPFQQLRPQSGGGLFGPANPPTMAPREPSGGGLFEAMGGQSSAAASTRPAGGLSGASAWSNSTASIGGPFGPFAPFYPAAPTGRLFGPAIPSDSTTPLGRFLVPAAPANATVPTERLFRPAVLSKSTAPTGGLLRPTDSSVSQSSTNRDLSGTATSQPTSAAIAPYFVYEPLSAAATGIFGGPITQVTQPHSDPSTSLVKTVSSSSQPATARQSSLQSPQQPIFGVSGHAKQVPRSPPGKFGKAQAPRILITDKTMPSTKTFGSPCPSTLFFDPSQLPRYVGPDSHWDFEAMSAVARYAPWSFEEMRLSDYTKGITGLPRNLGEHLKVQSISKDPANPGPPVPPVAPARRPNYSYGQVFLSPNDNTSANTDSMQTDPKDSLAPKSVAIKVGPTLESEFIVHERILQGSEFFRLALKREWKEGQQRVVELTDDDPDIFAIYAQYLYSGFITSINKAAAQSIGSDEDCEFQDLVSAYCLGEKLQDDEFQDAVVDAFIEKVVQEDRVDLRLSCQVYDKTPPGSGLRRLLLDIYLRRANPAWLSEDTAGEELHPEFLRDLSMEMLRERRQETRGRAASLEGLVLKGGRTYYKHRAR